MHWFVASLVAVLALAGPALGQTVKKGTLSGTVVSASATAPSGGTQADLLTTPATGSFLLTQLCLVGAPGFNNVENGHVAGSTLGRIAQVYTDGNLGSCSTWEPGLAIPAGETLRCVQTGASAGPLACTITGVQSKK
jgi:hypothetical protein